MIKDLAEEVFLSTRTTLSATSAEALLIDLQSVTIDSIQAVQSKLLPNAITVKTNWRVGGTVYHWGHRHQRELLLGGNITLSRDRRSWKISGISQTQPARFQPVPVPENGS
jgi:hypothetical protein